MTYGKRTELLDKIALSKTEDWERRGKNRGNNSGVGPGGYCVCPECGAKVKHRQGTPCYSQICPKCGSRMTRE